VFFLRFFPVKQSTYYLCSGQGFNYPYSDFQIYCFPHSWREIHWWTCTSKIVYIRLCRQLILFKLLQFTLHVYCLEFAISATGTKLFKLVYLLFMATNAASNLFFASVDSVNHIQIRNCFLNSCKKKMLVESRCLDPVAEPGIEMSRVELTQSIFLRHKRWVKIGAHGLCYKIENHISEFQKKL
jgi:hypothetical protein